MVYTKTPENEYPSNLTYQGTKSKGNTHVLITGSQISPHLPQAPDASYESPYGESLNPSSSLAQVMNFVDVLNSIGILAYELKYDDLSISKDVYVASLYQYQNDGYQIQGLLISSAYDLSIGARIMVEVGERKDVFYYPDFIHPGETVFQPISAVYSGYNSCTVTIPPYIRTTITVVVFDGENKVIAAKFTLP